MWQNGVAPRPPQRNELISPRFQWAFFVQPGKGNDRVVAKYSIEGRRPTTSPGLRSIPEPITVIGKAYFDVGHAPKDQSNQRKYQPGYAAWEIHPVMKLTVQ